METWLWAFEATEAEQVVLRIFSGVAVWTGGKYLMCLCPALLFPQGKKSTVTT